MTLGEFSVAAMAMSGRTVACGFCGEARSPTCTWCPGCGNNVMVQVIGGLESEDVATEPSWRPGFYEMVIDAFVYAWEVLVAFITGSWDRLRLLFCGGWVYD